MLPLVREFLADNGMTAAQIERVAYLVGHQLMVLDVALG